MKKSSFALQKENLSRRQFLYTSVLGIAGAVLPNIFTCGQKLDRLMGAVRPNVIIIVADDTGWNDVGYHGSEIKTPNIDRLARENVEFDQFYVYPVCSPTRACLLTGRPPSRHGIVSPLGDEPGLPKGTVTLAGLLGRNGYDTAITGKWHLGAVPEGRPLQYGFDYSYGYLRGQIDPYTHLYKLGDKTWHRNDVLFDEEGHATDLITDDALKFIKNPRDKNTPFFLYVPYSVPHYPLDEEKRWTDIYKDTIENETRRLFAASMTHMDDGIGRILSALKELDIEENTVVLFLSDNGGQQSWHSETEYGGKFKAHDVLGDNKPLREWKGSLYEGGIRVPAVMRWKGRLGQRRITDAVHVSDIFPTVAYLAGMEVPNDLNVEGINFWDTVLGGSMPEERIMYWRAPGQLALRKGDWKIVHNGKSLDVGADELYNISDDPLETKDLAESNKDKLTELHKELAVQLSKDLGDTIIGVK
ncbi:sulfatase-like hydrolase/transferase [candidate division KSB1 bacterium]